VVNRTQNLQLSFQETAWDETVERSCASWEGTPYRHGKHFKGIGVDCLHFAAAVLDDLYGSSISASLKSLAPDACVHNREGVAAAVRALMTYFPGMERYHGDCLQAGDLVITGPRSTATASHLMVAGSQGRLWHASSPRVCYTGYGITQSQVLVGIYRSFKKELWKPC